MLSELALYVLFRRAATPPRPAPTMSVTDQHGHRLAPDVELKAGDLLSVTGSGFMAGRPVHVQPLSEDSPASRSLADDRGTVRLSVTVPALTDGRHVIALVGVVPDDAAAELPASDAAAVRAGVPQLATFAFTTGAASGGAPSGLAFTGGLAYTGVDLNRITTLGGLLCAVGLGCLILSRHRARRALR